MSARKRKRSLDARQCRLARLHIAYSMPGWAFSDEPDDMDEFVAACEEALAEIDRGMQAMQAMQAMMNRNQS